MSPTGRINVIIIGSGNIGAFYDSPDSDNILTYAHAFTKDDRFNLLGFYDVNLIKAQNAAKIWNCRFYNTLEEAFSLEKIDVVCLAVPDEIHYEYLQKLSDKKLALICTEKPLAVKESEVEDIKTIYKGNIPILVNYSRRFAIEFDEIKKDIMNGVYGNYITGTGYYGKGLLHNGSHLINLLIHLLGDFEIREVAGRINDYSPNDFSISAELQINNGNFILRAIDSRLFTFFEMDLFFEKKRVCIRETGTIIDISDVEESVLYKGYKYLVKSKTFNTSVRKAMESLVDNIYNFLQNQAPLKCTLQEGYNTMVHCFKIKKKYS